MHATDIMSLRVLTVRPDASIAEAIRLMLQYRISGLPVIDAANQLVGIVTEGDFLRRAEIGTETRRAHWLEFLVGPGRLATDYVHSHSRKVADVMTADVVSVTEAATVDEIVNLMERRRVKRVPVLRSGKLAGIISRADLLHALARVVGEVKPSTAEDSKIREEILAQLKKQPWAPNALINVIVRDAIVDLKGVILDERERDALRVTAENVSGVKQVRDHLIWVEPMSGLVIAPDNKYEADPKPLTTISA